MNYEQWRDELLGQPPGSDPVLLEHSREFDAVPPGTAFDFVDHMLIDASVHAMFTKDQIGNGLTTVYSNGCSDLPFLYTVECDEARRVRGIRNLLHLYANYFSRYCAEKVVSIGDDQGDGPMGFICYMFWDVFVLYPGSATPAMVSAAIDVMRAGLRSRNESCIVSGIHGLGHWACDVPDAAAVLHQWLRSPTTVNPDVLRYARCATSGMIL